MPKYIAFLRAINVGGHIVKMDQLRASFEELGFSKVETFIASGNVIFETKSKNTATLERKIEALLAKQLGYAVITFVRSTSDVVAVAEYQPFPEAELKAEGNQLHIGFLPSEPTVEAKKKLLAFGDKVNDFRFHDREVYWLR